MLLNFLPLLDLARGPRRPRVPVRNIPDSIASTNDVLPPTTVDTVASSTPMIDFTTIALICGILLLLTCCVMVAARIRRQRLAQINQ